MGKCGNSNSNLTTGSCYDNYDEETNDSLEREKRSQHIQQKKETSDGKSNSDRHNIELVRANSRSHSRSSSCQADQFVREVDRKLDERIESDESANPTSKTEKDSLRPLNIRNEDIDAENPESIKVSVTAVTFDEEDDTDLGFQPAANVQEGKNSKTHSTIKTSITLSSKQKTALIFLPTILFLAAFILGVIKLTSMNENNESLTVGFSNSAKDVNRSSTTTYPTASPVPNPTSSIEWPKSSSLTPYQSGNIIWRTIDPTASKSMTGTQTVVPKSKPLIEPILIPTAFPTAVPTRLPTLTPTIAPTRLPTFLFPVLTSSTINSTWEMSKCNIQYPMIPRLPSKKGIGEMLTKRTYRMNAPKVFALDTTWYYGWGLTPIPPEFRQNSTSRFIPMVWDGLESNEQLIQHLIDNEIPQSIANGSVTQIFGFNEPDNPQQSNMTVAEAVERWAVLEALNISLVSPSCSQPAGEWMVRFMEIAKKNCLRIDSIGVHWYGSPNFTSFQQTMRKYHTMYGNIPLSITEFAPADWDVLESKKSNQSLDIGNSFDRIQVLDFMKKAIAWLEETEWILSYSWFTFENDSPHGWPSALFTWDNNLTTVGRYYKSVTKDNVYGNLSIVYPQW